MSFEKILKKLGFSYADIEPNSESDVEHKCIIPYLRSLGYTEENNVTYKFRSERTIQVGSKFQPVSPDIAVYVNDEPFLMIDSKRRNQTIDIAEVNQTISYALLYEFPSPKMFPYSIISNCVKWEVYNTQTRDYVGDYRAIPDIKRANKELKKKIPEVEEYKREQAQRFVTTRHLIENEKQFKKIFEKCYNRIDAEGKKFNEALEEMSKLILAKIYEEDFADAGKRQYRFTTDHIEEQIRLYPKIYEDSEEIPNNATHVINKIFKEANKEYQRDKPEPIFPKDSKIRLEGGTVKSIVKLIQDLAFYGSGEDIKGVVYETFLKEIFRGERGQFFTPREVVRFMISLVDPKPGEKIIDPSCGSGGFLIHSFLDVRKKIMALPVTDKEKKEKIDNLLENDLWGIDKTETLVQFCKINLIIHGDGYKNIHRRDSLNKNDGYIQKREEEFDIVLANPPFDLPMEHLEEIKDQYELFTERGYNGADVLFLERCYELCKPGGRIAIVLPHRFIDSKNMINLRQWILDKMIIRAVVNLPVGVFKPFGGSNARTSVLYMRKPLSAKEKKGNTLMSTIRYVGFELGTDQYRPINQNDLDILSTSEKLLQLKEEERKIHGIF